MEKQLAELKQRLGEIDNRQKEILSAVDAADKIWTDEQREEFDKLDTEFDAKKSEVEKLQADIKRQEQLGGRNDFLRTLGDGRQSLPDDVRIEVKKPEPFKSLGEQLQAIATASMYPERHDNRLTWEQLAPATGGAVSSVPSDGGYLVQKDFTADLMNKVTVESAILSRCRRVPISSNSDGLKVVTVDETSRATGSRFGGVQVYWGAEADAATAKKPKFRQMELELKDLIGLAYATDRLLQDASAVGAVFSQAFSEEMRFMLEDSAINGTGAGQPLGIINSPCIVSVAKETGQAATTLVYENVLKMWSRMWARSRSNAIWLINQDVEPQLHSMSIPVGTGGLPVYLPPGGLSQSPYASLFGRPVVPVEYCATLGTTGDILLCDFSQYLVIEKGGMSADSSIHVRFTTNERTFRFIVRHDGQPIWNSALTPYKGSATQSPFIKLDTRS